MNILQPTQTPLTDEKYQGAEQLFLNQNKELNTRFFLPLFQYHCSGKIIFNTSPIPQLETIGTQLTKDIYNYYESLKKRVVTFSELETQRKLIFLKSHSSYGDTYFKLPKNITVCFLTGVNKYGFTDFVNKGGMFTRKYGKKRRARYFNSISSYH